MERGKNQNTVVSVGLPLLEPVDQLLNFLLVLGVLPVVMHEKRRFKFVSQTSVQVFGGELVHHVLEADVLFFEAENLT